MSLITLIAISSTFSGREIERQRHHLLPAQFTFNTDPSMATINQNSIHYQNFVRDFIETVKSDV